MADIGAAGDQTNVKTMELPSFWRFTWGFWSGATRVKAWAFTSLIMILVATSVTLVYAVNVWQKHFFDALQQHHIQDIYASIIKLIALLAAVALVGVAQNAARMGLQVEWRRWVADRLIRRWMSDRTYYKLTVASGECDNPEARMTEDARLALEPVIDLSIGFLHAVLSAGAFLGVLALVGGALHYEVGGLTLNLPFGFVIVALLYAAAMSSLSYFVGRPLIAAVQEKNQSEASLRYELTRVRESAESIALICGDDEERRTLLGASDSLIARWWRIIAAQSSLIGLVNANVVILPLVPLVFGASKFIADGMSLGDLIQVAAAFVQVQMALNWIMDNFIRLAEWRASANRVMEMVGNMDCLDAGLGGAEGGSIKVTRDDGDTLRLENVIVRRDDGAVVIHEAENIIHRGDRVMVSGESGAGKSTLIRAIAGLWPWGQGEIIIPRAWSVMFLPQSPYLPLGTLRAAVAYPRAADEITVREASDALRAVGLEQFVERLDEEDRWDRILSGGERQRIAFARVLLSKPDLVVMDEATSALDEESQSRVMITFMEALPRASAISVAHRPSLAAFHNRTMSLRRVGDGVKLVSDRQRMPRYAPKWRWLEDIGLAHDIADPRSARTL
ncbi:putative ATP-binding cassette transporter [Rhodoblastus sphagnicola]|nr:ABC transporter ATP-binding protein/permease [Rhodoblastus sphagnicola]MBB4198931.1 putative ATP-binding cassette transporter [Rhodoblastus sphagnicola]